MIIVGRNAEKSASALRELQSLGVRAEASPATAGGGKVINVASILAPFGAPYASPYCASKGAIVQFTKSLAMAWAKDRIQVNAVLPGWIDTELTASARAQVPGLNERVLARTPAGRWGRPGDLAGVACSSRVGRASS